MNIEELVKEEKAFLSDNDFEKDAMGRFIYESVNRRHLVNLPHILADYKDAFLKHQAVSFGVFLSEHHVARRGGIWVSDEGVISTTEELFELFLNSTPNGK